MKNSGAVKKVELNVRYTGGDMKLSGFSFVRNGDKLYYPVAESIRSILPIVDEFFVAVGRGDEGDRTRDLIAAINDPKVHIIDTEWDPQYFKGGIIHSMQTDIAMQACSGDWLIYLQADEVIHEKYLPVIKARCQQLLDDPEVEGLLFKYRHFWGDYDHYQAGHGWYKNEIRIVRNLPDIHSYQSAQSFRHFDFYDNPRQAEGTRKLRVARVEAEIFHYGWVRPPSYMQTKKKAIDTSHKGIEGANRLYADAPPAFDYGPLNKLAVYSGTHPQVMAQKVAEFFWADQLQYSGHRNPNRAPHKHETLRCKVVSLLERVICPGDELFGFKNYQLLKK